MKNPIALLALASLCFLFLGTPQAHAVLTPTPPGVYNPCATPTDPGSPEYNNVLNARAQQGEIDLVFLGDSITLAWRSDGSAMFDQRYVPKNAVNFGLGGHKVEHLLWRLQNGNLAGYQAKVVVLLIGTNNVNRVREGYTSEHIAGGIIACINEIKTRQPLAKIILMGIVPRGETPNLPERAQTADINAMLAQVADNDRVFYNEFGSQMLLANGNLNPTYFGSVPDWVHIDSDGYLLWANNIQPRIDEFLTTTTTVATPTFNPLGGTYASTQSVTISTATSGATIRYTTNGTTPSSSSPIASGAISVASNTTLKVRGFLSGSTASATASATYTITSPTVAAPTFSPPGGTYSSTQNVTISTVTSGATIRYTTDGSDPTSSSPLASAAISIPTTTNLRARAFLSGSADSAVATATYTINSGPTVATPTFSPAGGNYTSAQNVTISTTTSGATIRYTTNGTDPTGSSPVASGPISVATNTTLKAKGFLSGSTDSAVASTTYTINSGSSTYRARFYPRGTNPGRMLDGKFQGSNTSSTSGFVDLATITTTPQSAWTEINIGSTPYRYLRYLAPANSYGNIAELEFYEGATELSGTIFGTSGSYNNNGNTIDKVFDGLVTTHFDAPTPSGAYVGIDTGGNGLQIFRTSYSLSADGSQDLATPAGDGVCNLLKYALNMLGIGIGQTSSLSQPNSFVLTQESTAGLPAVQLGTGPNAGKLQFSFIRRKASSSPGISYFVQFSDAVGVWANNPSATEQVEDIDTTFERVTVTDSIAAASKRFVRLQVSAP